MGFKVFLPDYFDDCFKLGLKCPERQYTYPKPDILYLCLADLLTIEPVFEPVILHTLTYFRNFNAVNLQISACLVGKFFILILPWFRKSFLDGLLI